MSSMVDAGLATATSQRRRLKSHCTATFRSYITQSAKLVTHLWCRRLRNGHDTASTLQQQSSLQCPRSAHWRGPLPPALDTSAHSGIGCVTSSTIKAATAHGLDNLQQLIVTKLYIALEFQQVLQRLLQCPSLLNRILQHGLVAFLQSCTCKCKAAATRECSLSGHVRSTWVACASFDCHNLPYRKSTFHLHRNCPNIGNTERACCRKYKAAALACLHRLCIPSFMS